MLSKIISIPLKVLNIILNPKRVLDLPALKGYKIAKSPEYKYLTSQIQSRIQLQSRQKNLDQYIYVFSSSVDGKNPGDSKYNGGVKLYNLWVKQLTKMGLESYIVTHDGKHLSWLIDSQKYLSIDQLKHLINKGKKIKFITAWLPSKEFIDLASHIYFIDAELSYTSSTHATILEKYLSNNKIYKIATQSRITQAWYKFQHNINITYFREWSDSDYWFPNKQLRIADRVGYMTDDDQSEVLVKEIADQCKARGVNLDVLKIEGSEKEVLKQMQSCSIFLGINTGKSLKWGEGFARTQQEAMHCGCVVIAFDVGGNREYLIDQFSGILVEPNDTHSMSVQLISLLKNKSALEKLRKQSISFVQKNFSPNKVIHSQICRFLDIQQHFNYSIHSRKELDILLGSPVFLTTSEIRIIQEYAQKYEIKSIVEIGAAFGASTATFMLSKQENCQLASIDPFVREKQGQFQASALICKQNTARIRKLLTYSHNDWKLIVDYSHKAVRNWNKPIDLLFIDGNHTYKATRQDFNDWSQYVTSGGYVLFHDSRKKDLSKTRRYKNFWPGPARVIREVLEKGQYRKVAVSNSITILKKYVNK